ncbi:Os07g0580800 [Oryza sativa Japonica Group]|uniref:Os07g0580800 protein n=2 Tax=Oryza sativa subsp. japonica TaxID=39947 RepID=B7FAA3_ORYSJ|nr:hypothetical protein OsJ_24883 [Oryza sativa Japonica Group]BAH01551.1 unnamed protein product [Oryza sativa Japonica Group]BAT02332.1 Os07g0580800 [Oryza sativa Japonica Group]
MEADGRRGGGGLGQRAREWRQGKGAGGGVVFLVVGQANPVWGTPPLLCGELLCRLEAVVSLQGKLRLPRQCCSLSGLPWAAFDGDAGVQRGGGGLGQRAGEGGCCGSLVIGRTGSRPAEGRRSGVAEAMCRRCLVGGFGFGDGPWR